MKLSELKTDENIKVLVFGDSGAGKTCFAAGFPGPIHYFDFDLKVSSVAGFLKGDPKLEKISYEQYPFNVKEFGAAGRQFNHDLGEIAQLFRKGERPFETIVVDSLTTASDRLMEYIMKENPGIKRTNTKGGAVPALQDYGVFRVFMKQFIGEILSLPCNVIFTAHINVIKDDQTGQVLRVPMLAGKLATELPIYFEEVYRAYVEGEGDKRKYMAQTQADRRFNCRSQRGLPMNVELKYESLVGK